MVQRLEQLNSPCTVLTGNPLNLGGPEMPCLVIQGAKVEGFFVEHPSVSEVAQQFVTGIITAVFIYFVSPTAGAKHRLLFKQAFLKPQVLDVAMLRPKSDLSSSTKCHQMYGIGINFVTSKSCN